MTRTIRIVFGALLLGWLLFGCGGYPGPKGYDEIEQAIVEPSLCTNGYNPDVNGWPTVGYCEWRPGVNCPNCSPAPNIAHCPANSSNPDGEEVYIYSGEHFTGLCTVIYDPDYPTTPVSFPWNLVAKYGWYSSVPLNGVPSGFSGSNIMSFKLGGRASWAPTYLLSTSVTFGAGPDVDSTIYQSRTYTNANLGPTGVLAVGAWRDIGLAGFRPASIRVTTTLAP